MELKQGMRVFERSQVLEMQGQRVARTVFRKPFPMFPVTTKHPGLNHCFLDSTKGMLVAWDLFGGYGIAGNQGALP